MSRGACEVSVGVRGTSAGSPRRTDRGWPLGSPRRYIKTVRTGAQHGGGAGQQGGDGTPRGVWCVGCRSCGGCVFAARHDSLTRRASPPHTHTTRRWQQAVEWKVGVREVQCEPQPAMESCSWAAMCYLLGPEGGGRMQRSSREQSRWPSSRGGGIYI